MQPREERVVAEEQELSDRAEKLEVFINGDLYKTLPDQERELLYYQHWHMMHYRRYLRERIALFGKEPK